MLSDDCPLIKRDVVEAEGHTARRGDRITNAERRRAPVDVIPDLCGRGADRRYYHMRRSIEPGRECYRHKATDSRTAAGIYRYGAGGIRSADRHGTAAAERRAVGARWIRAAGGNMVR